MFGSPCWAWALDLARKHFGLVQYQPQANHFVVFDAYWSQRRPSNSGEITRPWLAKLPGPPAPYAPEEWRKRGQSLGARRATRPAGAFQRAGSSIASNSSLSLVAAMAQGRL
eukprot:Skav211841  [mRNA]  locus=scaffold305:787797:788132:+ [translate_table: standard]